ncbi:MAG: hypothetical protein IKO00_10935 [Oscillospiraceae bacterium]|nr:hypothetical protein [Oscillospiraceae bacterium]
MYKLAPISDRVKRMREMYRTTTPEICLSRYRLITEFYMAHPEMTGIIKRAKNFKNICENIAIRIGPEEVIVGAQSAKYKAAALYPENGIHWLIDEAKTNLIETRELDPYIMHEEDKEYFFKTVDFWEHEQMGAKFHAYMPESYMPHAFNGATSVGFRGSGAGPVGHFCTGYNKAIRIGFGAIKEEADRYVSEFEEQGIPGETVDKYNFYRSVSIVCEGMITLTKRYAALAQEMADHETNPARREELQMMADGLNWTMEKPSRTFYEAIQCIYMYQTCLCLDANMHGISFGRIDQYLGDYYDADIKAGRITPEYGQELMDLFYLKVAEMNRPWDALGTQANPGYTSGQLMTLGGVDKDGNDASNAVTYMMLQTSGRLVLHSPPQALRIHKGTPEKLWEAALETTKIAGGVPSFENDDVIIPTLMSRGLSLESARNYCLIGCVEPGGCGDEWPACGGDGADTYWNIMAALFMAMNNGISPRGFGTDFSWDGEPAGPQTGYLYEMTSFEQLLEAFKEQVNYFMKWHVAITNIFEYVAREYLPQPVVSATMEGCMESGKDVMYGGAKFNSTGVAGVGIGNVGDSLQMIKYLVFDSKKCTGRELYDALKNNWDGYEDLHAFIKNHAQHYGNGMPETDKWTAWAAQVFADAVNCCTGPRGRYSAGLYPITTNIMFGKVSPASPDGRYEGEPLADGISPVQQMDTNGPTAVLASVSQIKQTEYPNGTLLNMKFHPSSINGEDGIRKLSHLLQTYFDLGGMEVQLNIINSGIMRAAQEKPEDYQNLVVRVAGFSTYFVELHREAQNDLISRTELQLG